MLVNLILIPNLPENEERIFVFAFEELENNLHPALQRRVFDFICQYAESEKQSTGDCVDNKEKINQ